MKPESGRLNRFFGNVIWGWLGVGVNLIALLLVTPQLIKSLGAVGYGIWSLTFALGDYYGLFDLGFRSATVKYVAHHSALGERRELERVLNGSLAYTISVASILLLATIVMGFFAERLFKIPTGHEREFQLLLLLMGCMICGGMVFQLFANCLEAVQRFDLTNQVSGIVSVIRMMALLGAIWAGWGILEFGAVTLAAQMAGYAMHWRNFRREFKGIRLEPWTCEREVFSKLFRFSLPAFAVSLSTQLLWQLPPIVIGVKRSATEVGFFNLPVRLLQYTIEAVGRIGLVSGSNVAELVAKGERKELEKLAILPSRYSVLLFSPLVIFLLVYGKELLTLWLTPEFGEKCYPVMVILSLSNLIAVVGQFNSGMMLMAMARHDRLAVAMVVEVVITFCLLFTLVAEYAAIGAAWISGGMMVLSRGLFMPYLLSKEVGVGYFKLQWSIYGSGFGIGAVVMGLLWGFKQQVWTAPPLYGQVAIGVATAAIYYVLVYFFAMVPEHRDQAKASFRGLIGRLR